MLGFLGFSILAIGATVYFGSTLLKKSSDKLLSAKLDNRVVEKQEELYIQAKKNLVKYEELGNTIAKVLPKDKDQARAVEELYKIGDETGIDIVSISFPASTLGVKAAKPAAGTTNTATTPSAAKSSVTQAKPVDGIQGVQGIDINLTLEPSRGQTISYNQMLNFLNKVQNNRRNMQITQVSVQPDVKNGGLNFSVSLRIFVKP